MIVTNMDIDSQIKDKLNTRVFKKTGRTAEGCINKGEVYQIDDGFVFIKKNDRVNSLLMFEGEMRSLNSIIATNTVRVPKPILVMKNTNGMENALVLEYLDMKALREHSGRLGELIANMHLHNQCLANRDAKHESWIGKKINDGQQFIDKFGFFETTCCGYLSQDNEWRDDWVSFYARNRLEYQLKLVETNYGDRESAELWSHLQLKIPQYFNGIESAIIPALLHGDLWSGNAAQLMEEPVIFDAASFYGHSEFELSICIMFGGFSRSFFDCYHRKIPKTSGFDGRIELYQLFHYLNHWNHFGGGYRQQSLALMRKLIK